MINPQKSNSSSESGSRPALVEDKPAEPKPNPGMMSWIIQKVNPFKTSSKCSKTFESGSTSSSTADSGDEKPGEHKQTDSRETAVTSSACPPQNDDEDDDDDDDEEGLLEWWKNVEGWNEWNETTNFDADNAEEAITAAADRVFSAARLFVYLFEQREASLYTRVIELLAVADAADSFHKKTVTASVGGGVASVAGSITTITGLALAPFTLGSSLIVTAVGIGVATAGGLASASANITDTMHSRTDRAKVEQIILNYQEEIKDIRECLQFLQTGMETLEEHNFQEYMASISERAMNKNVKHVVKEGGRAGKALLINAESLANTVQVLSTAGGVAKATQVLSVASGVMSGLFLALDVFFLAKDSRELHKGAKTKFAGKIRDVCRELTDGLVELKQIKKQLQDIISDAGDEQEEEEEEGEEEEEEEEEEKRNQ